MKKNLLTGIVIAFIIVLSSCQKPLKIAMHSYQQALMAPNYSYDTLRVDSGPLSFRVDNRGLDVAAIIEADSQRVEVYGKGNLIRLTPEQWKQLAAGREGGKIQVTVCLRKTDIGWVSRRPFPVFLK